MKMHRLVKVPEGMYYNAAYSGHMIAMPQPLYGDDVDLCGWGRQLGGRLLPKIWSISWPGQLSQQWKPANAQVLR